MNFRNFAYFLAAPTLCYQPVYPRSAGIRKPWLARRIVELVFFISLMLLIFDQHIVPAVEATAAVTLRPGSSNVKYIGTSSDAQKFYSFVLVQHSACFGNKGLRDSCIPCYRRSIPKTACIGRADHVFLACGILFVFPSIPQHHRRAFKIRRQGVLSRLVMVLTLVHFDEIASRVTVTN